MPEPISDEEIFNLTINSLLNPGTDLLLFGPEEGAAHSCWLEEKDLVSPLYLVFPLINHSNQYAGGLLQEGELSLAFLQFYGFNLTGLVHIVISSQIPPCVASTTLTLSCIVALSPCSNNV